MRFYLARWVGDGTEGNEYRPDVDADRWAAIDLRPDATRPEGRVLVAVDGDATTARGVVDLGDDETARSATRREAIASALGVTLQQDTLRGALAELLILHGEDPTRRDRTRWARLKQNRAGRHRIVALGRTLYDAPAILNATITDNFNRANEALGDSANWSEVQGGFNIVSNQVATGSNATAGQWRSARYEADLDSDDHYAEIEWLTAENSNSLGAVTCRYSPSAATYYLGGQRQSQSRIDKVVTGSITSLATGSGGTPSKTVKLEVDGSALELFFNDVSALNTTDTSITGNLRAGIAGHTSSAHTGDNFEAGDLAAGGTQGLTGSTFTKAPTFPTGAVAAGAVGLTGTTFVKAPTFGTGTIAATYALTGTTFVKAPTFGTGTVAPGAVELVGTTFQKAPTFGTGTISQPDAQFGYTKNPVLFTKNPVGYTPKRG